MPRKGRSPLAEQPIKGRSPLAKQPIKGRSPLAKQPIKGRSPLAAVLVLSLMAGPVAAEPPAATQTVRELSGVVDPLDRARIVARLGDRPVLAALAATAPVADQLLAVRATAWLAEPAAALDRLCELLEGRDPDIAPAAGLALVKIAQRLAAEPDPSEQLSSDELKRVLGRLQGIAKLERVRPDLRLLATQAAAHLAQL